MVQHTPFSPKNIAILGSYLRSAGLPLQADGDD